jgi:hypothetical protein
MIKRIWVEVLRHPDGCPTYGSRGQLYRTKLGDAGGPVLCERTMTPTLDSCRALLACGITGPFETWHEGDSSARLMGDIANVAKLEVKEGPVRFVRYEPAATAERVLLPRPDSLPVSDGYVAGLREDLEEKDVGEYKGPKSATLPTRVPIELLDPILRNNIA